ncbi:hypothetical protein F7725_010573 [Dissostichus mawsoni]|uniref:Secreted protein n=1 Tax=Dissostichus mawsoni TaxID=36200 RepID=A0A7J5XNV3_DISMA|nr:hypothetical protein F7725_010573 [Dissostichus mawsoni]
MWYLLACCPRRCRFLLSGGTTLLAGAVEEPDAEPKTSPLRNYWQGNRKDTRVLHFHQCVDNEGYSSTLSRYAPSWAATAPCQGSLRGRSSWASCNSLPQLLQITDGFFFPTVLQFEIGSFSYKSQVISRSGLWRRRKSRTIIQ